MRLVIFFDNPRVFISYVAILVHPAWAFMMLEPSALMARPWVDVTGTQVDLYLCPTVRVKMRMMAPTNAFLFQRFAPIHQIQIKVSGGCGLMIGKDGTIQSLRGSSTLTASGLVFTSVSRAFSYGRWLTHPSYESIHARIAPIVDPMVFNYRPAIRGDYNPQESGLRPPGKFSGRIDGEKKVETHEM